MGSGSRDFDGLSNLPTFHPSNFPSFPSSILPFLGVFVSALFFLAAASAVNADEPAQLFAFKQPHMGTLFRIRLYAEDEATAKAAAAAAFERVADLEAILSDYVPGSELNRFCESGPGKAVRVSDDLFRVLESAQALARLTGGSFDVTIGHYTQNWRRSLRKGQLPEAETMERIRKLTGFEHLRLDRDASAATLAIEGMRLDLGGIAKGFAADEALRVLKERGYPRAAVAAGGDIAVGDPPPGEDGWDVGVLAMDAGDERLSGSLRLTNAGVSTSGDREQFVEIGGVRYSHIVDPKTGLGLTRRITATAIAPSATESDSLATALSVLGPEKGIPLAEELPGVEARIIVATDAGEEEFETGGFPAGKE